MFVDWVMSVKKPKYVLVSIGANNLNGTVYPTGITAAQLVDDVMGVLERVEALGGVPLWLGIPSVSGTPDNAAVEAANALIEAACDTNGWKSMSILAEMNAIAPSTWESDYYADLSTDMHPNDAGHALIGEIAERLFIESTAGLSVGFFVPFDATLPALTLSPDCPGKLKQVQAWNKVATAREIERY